MIEGVRKCVSMLKPIGGICQHDDSLCKQDKCVNWECREYYCSETTYPPGTLRFGAQIDMMTNRGWVCLMDCHGSFETDWGVPLGHYGIQYIYIAEEECGTWEMFDRQCGDIKRLVRKIQVSQLEKQWSTEATEP